MKIPFSYMQVLVGIMLLVFSMYSYIFTINLGHKPLGELYELDGTPKFNLYFGFMIQASSLLLFWLCSSALLYLSNPDEYKSYSSSFDRFVLLFIVLCNLGYVVNLLKNLIYG